MLTEFLERHLQTGNTLKPWGAAGSSYQRMGSELGLLITHCPSVLFECFPMCTHSSKMEINTKGSLKNILPMNRDETETDKSVELVWPDYIRMVTDQMLTQKNQIN